MNDILEKMWNEPVARRDEEKGRTRSIRKANVLVL
jgi:hypothetical protein